MVKTTALPGTGPRSPLLVEVLGVGFLGLLLYIPVCTRTHTRRGVCSLVELEFKSSVSQKIHSGVTK